MLETDPLLLEGLDGDDDEVDLDDDTDLLAPALAQAIDGTAAEVAEAEDEADDVDDEAIVAEDVVALDETADDAPVLVAADEIEEISLEEVDEGDEDEDEG